jgi:hypothetical protein
MLVRRVPILVCVLWVLPGTPNVAGAARKDCDRACLRTALDQYLNALIKHDPSGAPLSVGFRQTENAVVVRPGTGAWKTVAALGKVRPHWSRATRRFHSGPLDLVIG